MTPTVRKLGHVGVPWRVLCDLATSLLPRCHKEKRVQYSSLCVHYDIFPKYILRTTGVSGHGLKSLKGECNKNFLLVSWSSEVFCHSSGKQTQRHITHTHTQTTMKILSKFLWKAKCSDFHRNLFSMNKINEKYCFY